MRRRFKKLSFIVLLLIIGGMTANACAPPDYTDDYTLVDPPDISIATLIGTIYIDPDWFRLRFLRVPPGWHSFGSDPEDDSLSRGDEVPQVNVYQPGFWMMKGEVTNKEYAMCMEAGVCSSPTIRETGPTNHFGDPAYDDHPVVGVDWFQAEGYCEWIQARLPSEAEWEGAAHGASPQIYPWGNEEPTCDRANGQIPGCEGGGDTKPVGSYPLGASPLGFMDMAGNVREWMQDWYSPDAYLEAAMFNPTGPAEGKKKVVRGGGFNDFKENLRTTARWAYEPNLDFDDVGFRCVPVTPSYAPFCEPSYAPLCYDPRIPKDDEPCEPGQKVPGDEGVTLLGFGCPMNEIVCFQFSTDGGGNSGYTALVEDDAFTCGPLDDRPDIVECCGPEQPMGRNVEINICGPGGSPGANGASTTAMHTSTGIKLASFSASGVLSLMQTAASNCPDGYTYDPATGECIRDITATPCPENWEYDPKRGECVPGDPEEDCPPTTTFAANLGGCEPEEDECPEGFYLNEKGVCEPDENQGECPPGYYYNPKTKCCEPIKLNNFGCPEGYYWHEKYEKCVPIDGNNCGIGTTYNGYGECDLNPYTPGPDETPDGDCPPGLFLAAANICDPAEGTQTPDNPPPDNNLRPGDQVLPNGLIVPEIAPDTPDCPEGYYYDPKYERCIQRDPNGCPQGYFFDPETKRCIPTNGPGSPCPNGYVYDPKTRCCVPEPGMDSTRCPEDEETPVGTPSLTHGIPFQTSNFDPNSGECEDDDNSRNPGEPEDCPPTTFAMLNGNCGEYSPHDQEDPLNGEPGEQDEKECPNFWNPETQTCDYPKPECGENEYFNRRLGYCVPLQDDCCEIGQDYAAFFEECVDVVTKPRNGECPKGYELIDGLCWLIGRTEGQGGQCWLITRNTPQCVGPCEIGQTYNALTGQYEEPPTDPCDSVNCSSYGRSDCPSNCCRWDQSAAGGKGSCVSK